MRWGPINYRSRYVRFGDGQSVGGEAVGRTPMRVIILSQVFSPEMHPSAVMVEELACCLAARGHTVSIAVGLPHHPMGKLHRGYSGAISSVEQRNGFRVVRQWHPTLRGQRIAVRAVVMVFQALAMATAALRAGSADLVISYGPPLIGPFLAALVARRRGAKLVSVVYDLYPDVAVESGQVKSQVVIAIARWVERQVYRLSDRIIVLSKGFRQVLENRGVPRKKIEVVPVWLQPEEIRPTNRETEFRRKHGIGPDQFVVLYAGTIGLVSGASIMLDVAERLKPASNVLLLFVGEGQEKRHLEAETRRRKLTNLRFLPFQPRDLLNEVQASSDVSVVTLAVGRGRTSVPSKVIGYLAAGRPVVAGVDLESDTADCVRDGECGQVVAPGDAAALTQAIRTLMTDATERERCGQAARQTFEREYAAPGVLSRYASVLESLDAERLAR